MVTRDDKTSNDDLEHQFEVLREDLSTLTRLLREEANRILSSHHPRELPADKIARIDQYIDSL